MLIAFEAVDRQGSACAWDGAVRAFARCDGPAEAALVPLVDRLMREYGPVDALAVAEGPGSFTGLRVAVVAARTLAWTDAVPVHAVDSLAACAAAQGDGLWWVLLPLKRDTTFAAVLRVAAGQVEVLSPVAAVPDAAGAPLPEAWAAAVAIGPALATKPGLAERWSPGVRLGDPAGPDARGVARVANQVPPVDWSRVLPRYHQEPAPVLQRAARDAARA